MHKTVALNVVGLTGALPGAQSDKDALASAGLTGAGRELMNIWNELDRGAMKQDEAFEEADKAVRRRSASMEKEL